MTINLSVPASVGRRLRFDLPGRDLASQVERAMALPDGGSIQLPGGTWAHAGHRRVRDGARVALVLVPGLLRFDVRTAMDSFSFTVRNLSGLPVTGAARESEVRPYHRPEGLPLNEYEIEIDAPDGRAVRIVARVPPYMGALENDYSAVVLVD